jgi:hypothetical protein
MCDAISPLPQHVFIAWCLIRQWILLYGVVLSYAQGQIYLCLREVVSICLPACFISENTGQCLMNLVLRQSTLKVVKKI